MQRTEAEEVREQLLELLDERQEAGPTSYVVQRTTVEPAGDDGWMLEVVIRPSLLGSPVELRFPELRTDTAEAVTPEQLAWHVYQRLEDGAVTP